LCVALGTKRKPSVRDALAGECDGTLYFIPSVSSIAHPFLLPVSYPSSARAVLLASVCTTVGGGGAIVHYESPRREEEEGPSGASSK
jgi:hypothetical protein